MIAVELLQRGTWIAAVTHRLERSASESCRHITRHDMQKRWKNGAVVALFRHPLGLPISHTAIIPNNKDRIGESLGRFVEENFLTPENVMQRLARVNIAKAAGTWLAEPANSDRTARGICAMVPRVLTMLQDEDVARFLTRTLLGELEKISLSPLAGEVL